MPVTQSDFHELQQLMLAKESVEAQIVEIRWRIQDEVELSGTIDNEFVTASMTKVSVSTSYDKKNVEKAITMLNAYLTIHSADSSVKKAFEEVLTTLENGKTETQRSASLRIKFK